MKDLNDLNRLLNTELTETEAKQLAVDISVKNWNTYYQVIYCKENSFIVSRYFNEHSKYYALKGEINKH